MFDGAIVTKIEPGQGLLSGRSLSSGFPGQHPNHPYIVINDLPKIVELKRLFPEIYRSEPMLSLAPTN